MKFWFCAAEFGIFAILAAVKLVRRLSELVSEEDLVDCGVYTVVIGELFCGCLEINSSVFKVQVSI
jgi:hypothetical protein